MTGRHDLLMSTACNQEKKKNYNITILICKAPIRQNYTNNTHMSGKQGTSHRIQTGAEQSFPQVKPTIPAIS